MRLRRRAAAAWRLALDCLDLLIAAALAIGFAIAGATGGLKGDDLVAATLALLGVLALATFRERWERAKSVAAIRSAVAVATASKPWSVLAAVYQWELLDPDGREARSRFRKELRIEQDDVMTVYEFSANPPGTVTRHEYWGRRPGAAAERPLDIIQENVAGKQGRRYRLISLMETYARGDRLSYRAERDLEGFFDEEVENVSVDVEVPTADMTLEIVWPHGRPPLALKLERTNREAIWHDVRALRKAPDGRSMHVEHITDPQLGERVMLTWQWSKRDPTARASPGYGPLGDL